MSRTAAILLAVIVLPDHPSRVLICVAVFLGGIGNTINGPAQSALLPQLVEREHLAGAISLNSAQMNGARVLGPAIGSAQDADAIGRGLGNEDVAIRRNAHDARIAQTFCKQGGFKSGRYMWRCRGRPRHDARAVAC